jgi:hypothetical protein
MLMVSLVEIQNILGKESTDAMMEEYGNSASSGEGYVYREPVKAPINPPYKSALISQASINPK